MQQISREDKTKAEKIQNKTAHGCVFSKAR